MKVAAINDLSGFGKCSLVADIAVLSSMGIEVNPVPTAVLTAQTGFSSYYLHDMEDMVKRCNVEWKKSGEGFDGIITGYIPSLNLADQILDFTDSFKKENTLLLVDPVMGDNGKCYSNFSEGMLEKIKELTMKADIITPNLTELCLLTGTEFSKFSIEEIISIAKSVKAHELQSVVVTGIPENTNTVCNVVIHKDDATVLRSSTNGRSYSGTGDLFAASLMGNLLNGKSITDAVAKAADFISRAISKTDSTDRNYGINFEKILKTEE